MRPRVLLLLASVWLLAPYPSRAGEFSGGTQTIVRAFDNIEYLDGMQRVRSWRPFDQYVSLTWDELGARKAWTVDTELRYQGDWGTGRRRQRT